MVNHHFYWVNIAGVGYICLYTRLLFGYSSAQGAEKNTRSKDSIGQTLGWWNHIEYSPIKSSQTIWFNLPRWGDLGKCGKPTGERIGYSDTPISGHFDIFDGEQDFSERDWAQPLPRHRCPHRQVFLPCNELIFKSSPGASITAAESAAGARVPGAKPR
jgi:hypothetical protein